MNMETQSQGLLEKKFQRAWPEFGQSMYVNKR